jgi:hypothetical protein
MYNRRKRIMEFFVNRMLITESRGNTRLWYLSVMYVDNREKN